MPDSAARPRILQVVTHPMTAEILMRGQLRALARQGFEVAVAAAPGPALERVREREGVGVHPVPFEREMAPLRDLRALLALLGVVRRFRPHLVHGGTPKAGLLAMLAARLAGVPCRVYTVRGLRLETTRGWRRRLLASTERLAARAATLVVCVSRSLERRVVELGLAPPAKVRVLGEGSSNGVDTGRFRPRTSDDPEIAALRADLGIDRSEPVVGFVGRFTRDKGIADLLAALDALGSPRRPRLLLLGDFEPGDPVAPAVERRLREDPRVVRPGFVADPAPYYGLMHVLAFPSYREGFPNAPLEAAASGVPVAGYAATGTIDAVTNALTGTLVAVGDRRALAAALDGYLEDPDLARRHGRAGRARVLERFRRERVWRAWIDLFARALAAAGLEDGGEPMPRGAAPR